MVFGLGGPSLKGVKSDIALAKTDWFPGEVVQGQLTLSVTTPVECLGFTVGLVGVESLTWNISSGGEDSTTDYFDERNDIIRQEISLLQPGQEVLPIGQHVYPFAYPLPPNLPGTQGTIPTGGNNYWNAVHSQVFYNIEVKIHQKGTKEAKPVSSLPFKICALPLLPAMYPGRPAKDSKDTHVMFFCCFSKGLCRVTLSADRDTVDIHHGVLPLVATVANETSLPIKSLKVSIYQDVLVHIPTGKHKAAFAANPQLVYAKNIPETIAPQSTKDSIQLPVSMAEYNMGFRNRVVTFNAQTFNRPPLVPSCDLVFASVRFRVTVQVVFGGSFLTAVQADLPITLLNIPESASVGIVPVGAATVAPMPTLATPVDSEDKLAPTQAPQSLVGSATPVS